MSDLKSEEPHMLQCVLTGWGQVGEGEAVGGDMFGNPWLLRQAALPLVGDQECADIYLEGAHFTTQVRTK